MTVRIAIVDLGMGNLASVRRALVTAAAGGSAEIFVTNDPQAICGADKLVMPGQGAFGQAAEVLSTGVGEAVMQSIARGTPYLGICLGLQALFERSEEAPGAKGLGVFKGSVVLLTQPPLPSPIKIPHIGWNEVQVCKPATGPLSPLKRGPAYFYFVHSYHASPTQTDVVAATTQHGDHLITAAVSRDNVTATQFHPEKSQAAGLSILTAFALG